MTSRRGPIIARADSLSNILLETVPEDRRQSKANFEAIRAVCRALVLRATPLLPTAKLVAEEGRIRNARFPTEQTLYNTYREMISIWRRAFHDVVNIDSADPITLDQLNSIDTSTMDTGTQFIVQELQRHVLELTHRSNVLKEIISQTIPVPADDLAGEAGKVIDGLASWLEAIGNGAFELDVVALKVSKKTPPGTHVMDAETLNELRTLVDDYRLGRKARDVG